MKTVTVELLQKSALLQLKKMEQDDLIKLIEKSKAVKKFKAKLKDELKDGLQLVELHQKGKVKLKTLESLLNED